MSQHPNSPLGQPTREEFQAWRESPVSQWAFQALQTAAERQQQAWLEKSWARNQADPLELTELRTRADAYTALEDSDYADFCALNGQDPQDGETDG